MKHKKISHIIFSSIFFKSILILLCILLIPNMFIMSRLFACAKLEFNTNQYNQIILKNTDIQNGNIILNSKAKSKLLKEDIWIQFVDKSLNEVYSFNKPKNIPASYNPLSFVDIHKNGIDDNTVFIFQNKLMGKNYFYFLGFNSNVVQKNIIIFNPKNVKWLIHNIWLILFIDLFIIIMFSYLYFSKKLVKPMQKIIEYIYCLSKGNFEIDITEEKIYKEIFVCLNNFKYILKENKIKKELFEKSRQKWISHISHDMKTPLSSIKGFSELLKDDNYNFSQEEYKNYCNIIYDKTVYIEELIHDLNFSYKIKNGSIILKLEKINLVSFIQNLVKELLLNPNFEGKNISIITKSKDMLVLIDTKLMKRALSNLIVNFLIYNEKDAKITLELLEYNSFVKIILKDNGRGMSEEEVQNIFDEYFRGTNTTNNPNGSGLGMAIANELINLHKGKCSIISKQGIGTTLEIILNKSR